MKCDYAGWLDSSIVFLVIPQFSLRRHDRKTEYSPELHATTVVGDLFDLTDGFRAINDLLGLGA